METLYDLFPLERAEITNKGLFFNGYWYSCSIAIKEQWFIFKEAMSKETPIYVDRNDNEYILVLLTDGSLTIAYRISDEIGMSEQNILSYQEKIRDLKRQLKNRKRVRK
ncbi:hypothetical protein GC096_25930 [Paenibacillus sp. LMG 31461]|uniref:Uncharacterized protein n=1 Tax=Paenibacillus plantarum TaxID=2654975 RepID=A0ABX1XG97_9BACL|nr:hypothetical protein [Paenibacillus plantarum]NOU67488.1 hypothetical protein [Paenibacillus plantarum]